MARWSGRAAARGGEEGEAAPGERERHAAPSRPSGWLGPGNPPTLAASQRQGRVLGLRWGRSNR